jgi:N-acyl homoserine lactone hydrolase
MACDRVIWLVLGRERSPRWVSLEDGGDEVLEKPVTAALVHGPGGWVLLDTGLPAAFRDPALAARIYDEPPALAGTGDPLLEALAAHGLEPHGVSAVAVSHLHAERAGGLGHFVHGPPVYVQRTELTFALGQAGTHNAYWRAAYDRPGLRWRGLRGDGAIADGIRAVATPGHTPGHMSYLVRMESGAPWLLAAGAIDLQEGIDRDVAIGWSAVAVDAPLRRRSHDRLVALARSEGARLVPGTAR